MGKTTNFRRLRLGIFLILRLRLGVLHLPDAKPQAEDQKYASSERLFRGR
jgi:hypothetical protein